MSSSSCTTELILDDWKTISHSVDAVEFAGHWVAFTALTYYFGLGKGYSLDGHAGIRYGYIVDELHHYNCGESGYELSIVLPKEAIGSTNALIDATLKGAEMKMRMALESEIALLKQALKSKEASFHCGWYKLTQLY